MGETCSGSTRRRTSCSFPRTFAVSRRIPSDAGKIRMLRFMACASRCIRSETVTSSLSAFTRKNLICRLRIFRANSERVSQVRQSNHAAFAVQPRHNQRSDPGHSPHQAQEVRPNSRTINKRRTNHYGFESEVHLSPRLSDPRSASSFETCAIGVEWSRRALFGKRPDRCAFAVDFNRTQENHAAHAIPRACLRQLPRGRGVDSPVFLGEAVPLPCPFDRVPARPEMDDHFHAGKHVMPRRIGADIADNPRFASVSPALRLATRQSRNAPIRSAVPAKRGSGQTR